MPIASKNRRQIEFGDFQTPLPLARQVCHSLKHNASCPAPMTIIEPTCGIGSFLVAATEVFPACRQFFGFDINAKYVQQTLESLTSSFGDGARYHIGQADFFQTDWESLINQCKPPILVVGNPPWVTNAELGMLRSKNLPAKSNFQEHSGIEAITGKSNFDISEAMMIQLINALQGIPAYLALLCKTSVARKVLAFSWASNMELYDARICRIDAVQSFGAVVDACLFCCRTANGKHDQRCVVCSSLGEDSEEEQIGWRHQQLVSDVVAFDRWEHLLGTTSYRWRSGIKHDCRRVMEFRLEPDLVNHAGETVSLEDTYLFPMLKSSDVAGGKYDSPGRCMLVTQRSVGEPTEPIRTQAPLTWKYLLRHGRLLDRRASTIYRNRPRFSIFGVGPYSFAQHKVAISGFYDNLRFAAIKPYRGKPVMLDDTCYFLPCCSAAEANYLVRLLNSPPAQELIQSLTFRDAKRRVTLSVLKQINLAALANELGCAAEFQSFEKQAASHRT